MAYSLSTIRNRVLNDKLDDDSISPGIIDNFINDTQRSIFSQYELPFMEKIFSGVLSQGNYSFAWPTDLSLLQSLVITNPVGQETAITQNYLSFKEFNQYVPTPSSRDAGKPYIWTTYADKLFLDRPTDSSYTMAVFYDKIPTTLEDDADVPDIPEQYSEVLVLGAYFRALERNEDFDLAARVKQDYLEQVQAMVARASKRQGGKPTVISQPNNTQMMRRRARA